MAGWGLAAWHLAAMVAWAERHQPDLMGWAVSALVGQKRAALERVTPPEAGMVLAAALPLQNQLVPPLAVKTQA